MGQVEILIAGLLVAVAALSALVRVLSIPYPIVLVIGGALVGLVPALPTVQLDPDVVLLVVLPRPDHGTSPHAGRPVGGVWLGGPGVAGDAVWRVLRVGALASAGVSWRCETWR
jgi:hypothetical protein